MVRVIIERRFRPGKETELENLLVELRSRATAQPGYVSGETLRSLDDPSLWVVLSTWLDVSQWKAWEANPERKDIENRIGRIASAPAKVSVLSFIWKACWSENEAERWRNISSAPGKHAGQVDAKRATSGSLHHRIGRPPTVRQP